MSELKPAESLSEKFIDICATGFYSGYCPLASGTAGTGAALVFLAFLFFVFPSLSGFLPMVIFCFFFTIFSIWISDRALDFEFYGKDKKDPGQIVIDEFAGYFVTMIAVSPSVTNLIIAFIAFRFFDILKPTPAKQLEELEGGKGIVLDDVMAGVMANIVTHILIAIIALF